MSEATTREIIKLAYSDETIVCAFGLGKLGKGYGKYILEWLGIQIDFYCDNNRNLWETEVENGIICKNPSELKYCNKEVVCFLLIGNVFVSVDEIKLQLNDLGVYNIVTINELCGLDEVLSCFYEDNTQWIHWDRKTEEEYYKDFKPKYSKKLFEFTDRIAIYTCITDYYDEIHMPVELSDNCDLYIISDEKKEKSSDYKFIDINKLISDNASDPLVQNRYCKMHGHKLFSEYRYSIYIDGNLQILKDVSKYVNKIGKSGIAMHKLGRDCDCVYEEGLIRVASGRANAKETKEQLLRYKAEGMPRNQGEFACSFIVRDHANESGNFVMEAWYEEFLKGVKRDQISFPYVLWKNRISPSEIGILGEEVINNPDLLKWIHNKITMC